MIIIITTRPRPVHDDTKLPCAAPVVYPGDPVPNETFQKL